MVTVKNPEARRKIREHATMIVGENIRKLRLEKGWTQKEAAQIFANCSESYFRHIENGQKEISLVRVIEIADLFDVTVSELLEGV